MDEYLVAVLSNIGMMSFLALSAYLLLITGEISFGQQAFFAIGAYMSGIATVMWGLDLGSAILFGAAVSGSAAGLVGLATLRLRGLYFAIATLAFAELVRLVFEVWTYRRTVGGTTIGPNGPDGFGDIRYVLERNIAPFEYMLLIYALLGIVLAAFFVVERGRLGSILRLVGADPLLAATQGIRVVRVKVTAAAVAGAIAGVGGCLYAHLTTYVEPKLFNIMLGVHSLAYGLMGGLGTALGPLLGVLIDIGLLESVAVFRGYRMIVFGGLVALMLIVMPRGILDEARLRRLARWWREQRGPLRRPRDAQA
jgi:branched-chain amino acid transport system permease protein